MTEAVVLAAGRSSRMGKTKALLEIGGVAALERVAASLRAAGVERMVVVTGHEREVLLPTLERLSLQHVDNPDYDTGMFSSVQVGVAWLMGQAGDPSAGAPQADAPQADALATEEAVLGASAPRPAGDADAFLIIPVDCPLVSPDTLRSMIGHFARAHHGILYPTCCGLRGHPPLITRRHAGELLGADRRSDLRTFLGGFRDDEADLDVRDLGILMDMDTVVDYRALDHLAVARDAAWRDPAHRNEPALTVDDALYILKIMQTPDNVVRHCRAVAAVAETLARALVPYLPAMDVALARAGGLLHDMARLLPAHALAAEEVLANLGLPRLGAVIGEHMALPPQRPATATVTEHEIVYLADKLVADDELVGLDERQARALRKMGPDPSGTGRIAARIADARVVCRKIEELVGLPLHEILQPSTPLP